jgi:isopenicillin N synthase-like dioxygenase
MLYYRESVEGAADNTFWCGSHFDHGLFTALIPAFYKEAGLFVRTHQDGIFKKVVASDLDVLMFQVGEFGQLITNDGIRATEHRVHKASGAIERYTMALFFDAPKDTVVHSTSELTSDSRYGGSKGIPFTYGHWSEESFKRYIASN